jgi:arginase
MGNGPTALMARGLADRLRPNCETVETIEIRLPEGFRSEAWTLVELQRSASAAARDAISRAMRPIFLSGNCGAAALSATAALDGNQTGMVWFDAHGDCNTPETSPSGFLDGMCLAMMTGQCWPKLVERFDGFTRIATDQIIQIGVRSLDPEEKLLLESLEIRRIGSDQLDQLPDSVAQLPRRTRQLYVHLDADVLDTSEGAANSYACSGGLTRQQLHDCLHTIANTGAIAAASITSYDPACDLNGAIAETLLDAATILVT